MDVKIQCTILIADGNCREFHFADHGSPFVVCDRLLLNGLLQIYDWLASIRRAHDGLFSQVALLTTIPVRTIAMNDTDYA